MNILSTNSTIIFHWIHDKLLNLGMSEVAATYLNLASLLIVALILIWLIDDLTRRIILSAFTRLARRSKTKFDDFLVVNRVPRNLAHLLPLVVGIELAPFIFIDFPGVSNFFSKLLELFTIVLILRLARSFLNTLRDYFKTLPHLRDKPIDSYLQVFMIFAWVIGIFFGFALITGISVWKFFTALGAASAVVILVFRDTILGFVASIQVSTNDMVRIGDWITFAKYGADGDVTEINLATVKVQNFDKTITTIPTYALISDSFQNWRGMTESDGRRIKRSLLIKQKTIKFLTTEDVDKLKSIELLEPYLTRQQQDIDEHNENQGINTEHEANGRHLTNLGVFRKYIDLYLNQHSAVNKKMTLMVRHLQPTENGLPLEIYVFSKDKRWTNYEFIMADIFDHILASVKYFDLEIFERIDNSNQIEKA